LGAGGGKGEEPPNPHKLGFAPTKHNFFSPRWGGGGVVPPVLVGFWGKKQKKPPGCFSVLGAMVFFFPFSCFGGHPPGIQIQGGCDLSQAQNILLFPIFFWTLLVLLLFSLGWVSFHDVGSFVTQGFPFFPFFFFVFLG